MRWEKSDCEISKAVNGDVMSVLLSVRKKECIKRNETFRQFFKDLCGAMKVLKQCSGEQRKEVGKETE